MTTMRDVARLAGVSVATVSRVISQKDFVNPETAELVLKAVKQLQYEPNAVAQGLAGKKMGILALIVPDILNPFFSALARGVEDEAHTKGMTVIIGNTDDLGIKERSYIKALKKKHVDGFIFASNTIRKEDVDALRNDGIPVVLLDRGLNIASCVVVRSKNRQGANIAVQHLIEQGCQKIAHIYGPQEFITARQRLLGYEETVAGLDGYSPSLMASGQFDIESGRKGVEQLLTRHPDIDGIFAANDLMAVGALKALRERGIRVPQQVKVCGFDGIGLTAITEPELTTVAQSISEMGGLAVRILLKEIESGISENTVIEVDVLLVTRKSSEIGTVLDDMKGHDLMGDQTFNEMVATQPKILSRLDTPWCNGEEEGLPKGLNKATFGQISHFLQENRRPLSAEEVAEGVKLTRVTARRYLEFIEQRGVLKSELKYGTVGRPVKLFMPW